MTTKVHCLELLENDIRSIWQVPTPPPRLFVQGTDPALSLLDQLPEQGLAIVGTRNPQARSIAQVFKTVTHLTGSSLIIISGLARGIDAAAHQAAIQAGLPTIAILGASLDQAYPKENFPIRQKILQMGGLVISEFPPLTPARAYHFLKRNRLIAGWSKATWVVEASHRSGALNTAKWAREQDRICFATPCYPGDPTLYGNQTLLDRDHALPFWGAHSLGIAWLELTHHLPFVSSIHTVQTPTCPDSILLKKHVEKMMYLQGGTDVSELLNWGSSHNWAPLRVFSALQTAIQQKLLIDQNGVLVTP